MSLNIGEMQRLPEYNCTISVVTDNSHRLVPDGLIYVDNMKSINTNFEYLMKTMSF